MPYLFFSIPSVYVCLYEWVYRSMGVSSSSSTFTWIVTAIIKYLPPLFSGTPFYSGLTQLHAFSEEVKNWRLCVCVYL